MIDSARCGRPLIVRCGALGDMVLITALILDLSRRFAGPVDLFTSGAWSAPLLCGQPGVGDVITVRSRKTPFWLSFDQHRAVGMLRARGVGPTWFCDGNEAAKPMLARAGITAACMVDVKDHPLLPGEHATQQWRRLAGLAPAGAGALPAAIAVPPGAGGCSLTSSEPQRADLTRYLAQRGLAGGPMIAIQMGNKRTMRRGLRRLAANTKHWPLERWAAVLQHLHRRHPDHTIVLLGTGPEYRLNQELMTLARVDSAVNLADKLGVPRLVALLERCQGLITVDSGPAHAAAAVGCPQVVLFGRASTSLYRPWGILGSDVKVMTGQVDGEPNMLGIDAPAVAAAWDTLALRA